MRVALAQLTSAPGDVAANVAKVRETVGAHCGADLVVFPELFLSGYLLDAIGELASDLDGAELAAVRGAAAAAGSAVVLGVAERWDGAVANSAVLVAADGAIAGVYRKTHLFGAERDAFVAGDRLEPIELGGCRLGPMICFDVEFPEVARTLLLDDADALVTIAANMAPFADDHELAARARALESGLPHVYVNRSGADAGLRFVGGSVVVAPTGEVIGRLGEEAGVLEADLPRSGHGDERLDYRRHLRPELYRTA
ncbi:MAG TPA: nitrilase-related carbon-nitrogen hydrolase [Conexibacter sp.]|jgi:predicted amidohydrolase|nr:nitrilase-related carbon-nitrogen hydrolase [Conexibacter sp.]